MIYVSLDVFFFYRKRLLYIPDKAFLQAHICGRREHESHMDGRSRRVQLQIHRADADRIWGVLQGSLEAYMPKIQLSVTLLSSFLLNLLGNNGKTSLLPDILGAESHGHDSAHQRRFRGNICRRVLRYSQ